MSDMSIESTNVNNSIKYKKEISPKEEQIDNKPSGDKELSKAAKLAIGASAVATSVIAGLVIANQIRKGKIAKLELEKAKIAQQIEQEQERIAQQIEQNQKYVADLKEYMHQKSPVNPETIDSRLNPKNPELEALNDKYRTIIGEEAAEREQAYIDKTYNSVTKSAKDSADVYIEHFKIKDLLNDPKWLETQNIPKDSKYAFIPWEESPGSYIIEKENGVIIHPYFETIVSNAKEFKKDYYIPMDSGKVTINGKKYRWLPGNDYVRREVRATINYFNPQKEFDCWKANNNHYEGSFDTFEEFINLEKKQNISMYEKTCIDEFKNELADLLPTLKLGKKDKFVYVPQISEKGDVYIQKADGSVIINEGKGFSRRKPKSEGDDFINLDDKPINGKEYVKTATYTPTENGIIKTHHGKNVRTVEVDKKHGEIIISKDGYKYYYSIKGRELLDIKKIEQGKPVTLKSYNPPKAGKPGDDTPEIILIKLRGGGTAKLYKMPNGEILTSKEFHFPGSARQEKDFQRYLVQLEELKAHERAKARYRNSYLENDLEKEVEVEVDW